VSAAFDEQGNQLQLGKKLGEGGEGAVFDAMHNGENVAAKIYLHALPSERQAKLRAMAQVGDSYLKQISAWPISVLLSKRPGPVSGFTMPKFSGYHPVHELYGVGSRRHQFPKADFAFLVGTARNVAAAFDAIHAHGHAIGDVNENNIIVSHQGTVKLLDCDSFHVNTSTVSYPCTVGVPHYTPPELQGLGSFHGVTRTANHDNFGLAVLIFQLLFMARHPFSGVPKTPYDLSLERSIKEFRFAYGRDRLARMNDMPPKALNLDYLPPNIGDMFWRAFTEVGAKSGRPKAAEWVSALEGLLHSLRACSVEAKHKYPSHLHACVWCERDKAGTPYFTHATATGPNINFQTAGANIAALWSQIQTLATLPVLPAFTPPPLNLTGAPIPASARKGVSNVTLAYGFICFAAFALALVAPRLWWLWLLAGGLAIKWVNPHSPAELNTRRANFNVTQRNYDGVLNEYEHLRADRRIADVMRDLSQIKAQIDELPQALAREMKQLHSTLQARQLHDYLDRHFIRSAKISGVGEQRKLTLASFGIETAADITRPAIAAVPGFGTGLTANLIAWRKTLEQRFVPSNTIAPSPQDVSSVNLKIAGLRVRLEQELRDGATHLQNVRTEIAARQNTARGALEAAHQALAQAKADLDVVLRKP
jgi:DNA-binding helix-hairpin-helix protein with protein kinase domain